MGGMGEDKVSCLSGIPSVHVADAQFPDLLQGSTITAHPQREAQAKPDPIAQSWIMDHKDSFA